MDIEYIVLIQTVKKASHPLLQNDKKNSTYHQFVDESFVTFMDAWDEHAFVSRSVDYARLY